MSLELFPRSLIKGYIGLPKKRAALRRIKILPTESFNRFTFKHYPSIFLDERLRSAFDK